jgi:predicted MPP superfamily phosphohydrolase
MLLSRRAAIKGVFATTVGAVAGAGVYGGGYERHQLEITEASLPVDGLPGAFHALKVALLTDIHHSLLVSADYIARAVALANAQKPDLVILGGDYVTGADRRYMEPVADLLSALEAPLGVIGILGNHDDDREMPAALRRRGIEVLRDSRSRLGLRGEVLELAGIRFWTQRASEIQDVLHGARSPVLLLAHDPRRLIDASALAIPAMLAGHTHGGQIVVPVFGAVAARKFPVTAGLGSRGRTSIFVSRGVGTVYIPARINCPPEVAIITLVHRDPGAR